MSTHPDPGRWPHAADLSADEPVPFVLTAAALAVLGGQPPDLLPVEPVPADLPPAPIERGNRP
jgi:hypothetical protein